MVTLHYLKNDQLTVSHKGLPIMELPLVIAEFYRYFFYDRDNSPIKIQFFGHHCSLKDSAITLPYGFVFRFVLLVDWLPTSATENNLHWYLPKAWFGEKRRVHAPFQEHECEMKATDSAGI